ncbi:Uncharacterised protein [Acinetobacter baumannii]|nr:Uncharacterised protein [Acinetobacter baumannii]
MYSAKSLMNQSHFTVLVEQMQEYMQQIWWLILTLMRFVQSVDGSWEQIANFLRIFQFSGLNRWMKSSMHVLKPLLVATAMLYITLHIALHFYINKSRIFIKN